VQETIITLATPVFFALIGVELLVGWWRGRNTYRLNDAINSIGLGILSQISGVFMLLLRIGIYAWAFEHLAPWRLPADSVLVWLSAVLLYDLCYYWLHRLGHEVNILWAAHVVHHQSEDYNLSTALRQTSSGTLLGWLFYLPMAILGYPTQVFVVAALIDLLYQFWIHTEQIGRLGWFDRVFASPSNHRVHHAVNDRYLDRNYGGILILWDRLFGTFEPERDDDPPVYGTRSPLRSWNPLWANFEVYARTLADAWRDHRGVDRLHIWFAHPGWRGNNVAPSQHKPVFELARARFDPEVQRAVAAYGLVQFALLLGMTVHFLDMQKTASPGDVVAYFAYLTLGLWLLGELFEGHRRMAWVEAFRLVATAVVPWASLRWFGVPDLDVRLALGFLVVFGASLVHLALAFAPAPLRRLTSAGSGTGTHG